MTKLKTGILLVLVAMAIIGMTASWVNAQQHSSGVPTSEDIDVTSMDVSEKEMLEKHEKNEKEAKKQYKKSMKELDELMINTNGENSDEPEMSILGCSYYSQMDYTADGGSSSHGGSGVGYSDASRSGDDLNIFARAWLAGSYWAHARNWDEFTYSCDDHWAKWSINYYIKGALFGGGVGSADSEINIRLRIYDATAGKEVENKVIFSGSGSFAYWKYYDNRKVGYVYAPIKKGHKYYLQLLSDATADGYLASACHSDFMDGDRKVEWEYSKVEWI